MSKKEESWEELDSRRQRAIDNAVAAADMVILAASDGSEEELNYLTFAVMTKFAQKIGIVLDVDLRKRDLRLRDFP